MLVREGSEHGSAPGSPEPVDPLGTQARAYLDSGECSLTRWSRFRRRLPTMRNINLDVALVRSPAEHRPQQRRRPISLRPSPSLLDFVCATTEVDTPQFLSSDRSYDRDDIGVKRSLHFICGSPSALTTIGDEQRRQPLHRKLAVGDPGHCFGNRTRGVTPFVRPPFSWIACPRAAARLIAG